MSETTQGPGDADGVRATPPEGEIGKSLFVYRGPDRQPMLYVVRPAPNGHEGDGARPVAWGPAPAGSGWQPNLDLVPRPLPLYRLGALEGDPAAAVVFHRHERDVYLATMAGLAGVHTTTALGPGHLDETDLTPLLGRDVAVVLDDAEGDTAFADAVVGRAREAGARLVATVRLDEPAPGAGAEAWHHAGGTAADWKGALEAAGVATGSGPPDPLAALMAAPAPSPAALSIAPSAAAVEPSPLPVESGALRPFDLGLLPEPLRPYVAAASSRAGCAPEYPAVATMVALAAVAGRAVRVRPDPEGPDLVVPVLWGALVTDGPPLTAGPAVAGALKALSHLEVRTQEAFTQAQEAWRARRAAYRAAVQAWRRRVRERAPERHALGALAAIYPEPPVRPLRRRHQSAATRPEALVRLLNASPGGLLLRADDLAGWIRHLVRPGSEAERHFFLECRDGGAPALDFDGPDEASLHCLHPCLSVLGWITADACRRLLEAPDTGFAAAELLGHFSLAVYPEGTAPAPSTTAPDLEAAALRLRTVLERLDAHLHPPGPPRRVPPVVPFTPAAAAHGAAWVKGLEARLRGAAGAGDADPVDPFLARHLAGQRRAMPALALLIHLAERADGREAQSEVDAVPLAAAERATGWCEVLAAHARRLHGTEAPAVDAARALLTRLASGELRSPFTVRDVYRRHWTGLTSSESAHAAVALLERHAWLAAEPVPTTPKGGKPTRRYHVHPKARPGSEVMALQN